MGNGASQRHHRIREGDKIPSIYFKVRVRVLGAEAGKEFVWKEISTEELFKGKRIAMFSIPGAFTPVCSCDHLPSYESRYGRLKRQTEVLDFISNFR